MEIVVGRPTRVVFLLVDAEMQPVTGVAPVAEYNVGSGFKVLDGVSEMGRGWYDVIIPAQNIPGMLIFVASAPGTHEWRNIYQIVEPDLIPYRPIRTGTSN